MPGMAELDRHATLGNSASYQLKHPVGTVGACLVASPCQASEFILTMFIPLVCEWEEP